MLADLFRFLHHFWARACACDILPFDTNYSNCGQIQFPSGAAREANAKCISRHSRSRSLALAGWYRHAWNKGTNFNLAHHLHSFFFVRAHSHQYHIMKLRKFCALYSIRSAGIGKNSRIRENFVSTALAKLHITKIYVSFFPFQIFPWFTSFHWAWVQLNMFAPADSYNVD